MENKSVNEQNALTFYKTLFEYLNDKFLKLQEIIVSEQINPNVFRSNEEFVLSISQDVLDKLNDEHSKYSRIYKDIVKQNSLKFPDIIVVDVLDDDSRNKSVTPEEFTINANEPYKMSAKYTLDSAIIRDVNLNHFACVLTINNSQYGFDGESYKRLNPLSWKGLLTKNKQWSFQGSNTSWNFRNGYQQLFYYRIR